MEKEYLWEVQKSDRPSFMPLSRLPPQLLPSHRRQRRHFAQCSRCPKALVRAFLEGSRTTRRPLRLGLDRPAQKRRDSALSERRGHQFQKSKLRSWGPRKGRTFKISRADNGLTWHGKPFSLLDAKPTRQGRFLAARRHCNRPRPQGGAGGNRELCGQSRRVRGGDMGVLFAPGTEYSVIVTAPAW